MARIKYGALVTSIHGSIQGTTFQRNAYGFTVKGKPNMVSPNSADQNRAKARFSAANQIWRTLSDTDREAWNTYANTYPIPSRLNPDAYLSGLAAFIRWAGVASQNNLAPLSNPAGVQGVAILNTVTLVRDGFNFNVVIDATLTEGPWVVFIYLSRVLKPTQRFRKSWTRFIQAATDDLLPTIAVTVPYNVKFGSVPEVGDPVATQIVLLNTTNGQVLFGPGEVLTVGT